MSEKRTITDHVFPDRRFYEYILQRLRSVISRKTPVMTVTEIKDIFPPTTPDGVPSIELTIRIPGLTLNNPVTGQLVMSRAKIKEYFESWPVQENFLRWLGRYIADCIPDGSLEVKLRKKFRTVTAGRPGKLPPRSDLRLQYDKLCRQIEDVKKWLGARDVRNRGFTKDDVTALMNEAPTDSFWWLETIRRRDLKLRSIYQNTPQNTALFILTRQYKVGEDTIRSRLFRPEVV